MISDNAYEIVLSYPKLAERLKSRPSDEKKVKKIFQEIHGEFSPAIVKSASKFLDATFGKLYDGINLEIPEGMDFKKLKEKYSIILVPNHQSHADYVALTYCLFKEFEIPLRVAAGINLNVFPLGQFFGKGGAFFIRRTFTSDLLYKICFEAYVYYLLSTNQVVEFFFEGGRTRTGKLLKPKFGLYQMLLETHSNLPDAKPLMFIPVSLAHEHIPEEKAHARELSGGKKVPESGTQLFKLFKLFGKRLGTIHIHFGKGIIIDQVKGDLKEETQKLAFGCFIAVGKNMPVTPTSLLALVMLDEPSGAMTWKQIEERAEEIIDYCLAVKIALTPSLSKNDFRNSIRSALDMLIGDKKVEVIRSEKLNQIFYVIKPDRRIEVLYHKNMILHHFIVPSMINSAWFNVFNGNIKDGMQLTRYLMKKRKELKYEFYLPGIKEMMSEAMKILSYALEREIKSFDEVMKFSSQEMFQIATKIKNFSTALSYLYESYYISILAINYLKAAPFTQDKFLSVVKELFQLEIEHGRVIRYNESFAVPILKDTLIHFQSEKILSRTESREFIVNDSEKLERALDQFVKDLNDQVAINVKFNKVNL